MFFGFGGQHKLAFTVHKTLHANDRVAELKLSIRFHRALKRAKIETIGELVKARDEDRLWKVRNLGEKAIEEINAKLAAVEFDISMEKQLYDVGPDPDLDLEKKASFVATGPRPRVLLAEKMEDTLQTILQRELWTRRLHPNVEYAGFSLCSLAEANAEQCPDLSKRLSEVLTSSATVAEEIEDLLVGVIRASGDGRLLVVLRNRYGYTKLTLAAIGKMYSVTRERIRQIEKKAIRLVRRRMKSKPFLRIHSALHFADDSDTSFREWTLRLRRSGLLGEWSNDALRDNDIIELLIVVGRICDAGQKSIEFPAHLDSMIRLRGAGRSDAPAREGRIQSPFPKPAWKLIRRSIRHCGAFSSSWLASHDSVSLDRNQLAELIDTNGYIGLGNDWYMSLEYMPSSRRKTNVMHNSLRKMFQFCGPLTIRDVYLGLARKLGWSDLKMPPVTVLERMLQRFGYSAKDGLWYWDGKYSGKLNSVEASIWKAIKSNNGVVHHSELANLLADSSRSAASLNRNLARSPIFDNWANGLYVIRGTVVSDEAIARARSSAICR